MRARKSEVPFADRVALIWGGLHEIESTCADPDFATADFFQVSPEQLRAWRAAEGRHSCAAMSTRGRGCRNHASALIDYDPRSWGSRDPVFCPAHLASRQELAPDRSIGSRPLPHDHLQAPQPGDDASATAR